MSKVWSVNSYGNPVEMARKWGEVVEITEGNLNPFSIDRLAWSIAPSLNKFQPEDYFLLTGPGSGYVISTIILLSRLEEIKCLRYKATIRDYESVTVRKTDIYRALDKAATEVVDDMEPGRIYVINYSGHLIEPAFQYSNLPAKDQLVIITQGNIDQSDVVGLTELCAQKLSKFKSGDMLLLSGPALLHIICTAILCRIGTPFSILIFNPKTRSYLKREVDINHLVQVSRLVDEAVAP